MPFAGYKDFDDCVSRNKDKKDPKAYCATIMRQVEGKQKMSDIKRFIPITKIDDDERMVYGWASTPDLDSDGEIITLEAMKNALPEYMKFPTLREMHQAKAAGTTKEASIKDGKDGVGLWIGAKVVADDAWKMVKEGVYKGFSVGGHVVQKVKNMITALDLVEISLVDVPANKAAVIEVWKAESLDKNATGVAMLSELMVHTQYCIEMMRSQDKNSKKLESMMEQVKSMIAIEAEEKEMSMNSKDKPMLMSDDPTDLQKKIIILESLKFDDSQVGKLGNALRKGVIVAMSKKIEEVKKIDEEVVVTPVTPSLEEKLEDEKPVEVVKPDEEVKSEEVKEVPVEEKPVDAPVEPAKSEDETKIEVEEKDAAEEVSLKKIDEANEVLSKVGAVEKIEEAVEKTVSLATITKITDTLVKVAEGIATISERLEKAVATYPAPVKSKAAFVQKTIGGIEVETEVSKAESDELKQKKARFQELKKLRDELGANEFAKRGLSREAAGLLNEVSKLSI